MDPEPRHLAPAARALWRTGGLAVVGVALVAAVVVVAVTPAPGRLLAVVAAALLVAAALAWLWPGVAWRRWTYRTWDTALEVHHGVVVARTSLVPYGRIQQIDVRRGLLQRRLGLSTLVLRTAAATTDASVPHLAADVADELRRELLRRAGVDDAV